MYSRCLKTVWRRSNTGRSLVAQGPSCWSGLVFWSPAFLVPVTVSGPFSGSSHGLSGPFPLSGSLLATTPGFLSTGICTSDSPDRLQSQAHHLSTWPPLQDNQLSSRNSHSKHYIYTIQLYSLLGLSLLLRWDTPTLKSQIKVIGSFF